MQIYDELRLKKSNKNYGTYLRFGDGSSGSEYCYIAEPSDDSLVIFAKNDIDLNTEDGNVYINGSKVSPIESDKWMPVLNEDAIDTEYDCQGWYSKVGQVVNIGFYIKVLCYSGYEDVSISIGGLPFTPIYDTAGGGMCSGAYVAGGYNFQCFVAETDGTITTRVQKCNNTSDGRLTTSASGCNYPSDNVLTLSGTITYLTDE